MIVTTKRFTVIIYYSYIIIILKKLLRTRKTCCFFTITDYVSFLRMKINIMINDLLMHKMENKIIIY